MGRDDSRASRDRRAAEPSSGLVACARRRDRAARLVNALFNSTEFKPQLTDHDGQGWHLHAADASAPLAQRMRAELAMAFADVVRSGAVDRLRFCEAPECDAVLVDLSRNRSRRYCDTGNCGNRQHVAAYRARKAEKVSIDR